MPAKRKIDVRDLEADTIENDSYRKVVYTVPKQFQLVLMSLDVGETIPREIHEETTQFIRVERGHARVKVGEETFDLHDGASITIPPGNYHEVENAGSATLSSTTSASAPKRGRKSAERKGEEKLKLYTIYTPPEHPPTRHQRRQPKK